MSVNALAEPITLDSAIRFVRWLEPLLAAQGVHCALTGSVLYAGESYKDLDIIVYPHNDRFILDAERIANVVKSIFPNAYEVSNPEYPRGRRLIRDTTTSSWRLEFFIMGDVGHVAP